MEVVVIVPVWKRPEITRISFTNLKKTGLKVICAVSEDWAEDMCDEFGFEYVRTENQPLGRKKNKLMEYALTFEWDKVMEFGSDNLLDLKKLDNYLSIPAEHYAVSCIYFVQDGKAKYYDAHNKIWGALRVMSRQAVEQSLPLWDDKANRYLDSNANRALDENGYKYSVVRTPMLVDIKSEVNIWPYERFAGKAVDYDKLCERFPELRLLN